jgi:Zn-dependent peptidase ImmA (M78 family)/transcriptional regulator with XRE-family HTH domain
MASSWSGERIRAIRSLLDISQVDLADRANVSQSLVSQVESGVKSATDELITAIAEATGTPVSFFDVTPLNLPAGTLRWRRQATARRGDTKRLEVLVEEAWRVSSTLLDKAHVPPPSLPVSTGIVAGDDIEVLARDAREALGVGLDGPIPHLTRILERAGIPISPLVLPATSRDTPDEAKTVGHFGASLWPSVEEHAFIGYFPAAQGDRQRFTLAHELGHLVLHTKRRAPENAEGEAHAFAAELLVPSHRLREAMETPVTLTDLCHLKARWGVSIQALIMRGAQLGLLDEARKTSLYKQLSARGWRTHEPVDVPPESPLLLAKLTQAAFPQSSRRNIEAGVGLSYLVFRTLVPAA